MIRLVRRNLFGRIASFWRGKPFEPVKADGETIAITFKDKLQKEEFMAWLEDPKRTNFVDDPPPPEMPGLGL